MQRLFYAKLPEVVSPKGKWEISPKSSNMG
jgi:hypothetical protein